MLILFLKLLLAHILGDFVLFPTSWVEKRRDNVWYLLLHVLVHAVVLCLLFINELHTYYLLISFVVVGHLGIDSFKIWLEKRFAFKPIVLFVFDQLLHLILIGAVVMQLFGISFDYFKTLYTVKNLIYLIAFLLITVVSPIFLKVFFSKWNSENDLVTKKRESLLDAGLLIGIMERLIIVLFIQVGFLSGIGFLLAAKSIFRFGDLTNAKDTKFTEYILVGTLASFLIAIVIGYMLRLSIRMV